jgi:hypothetical protein
MLIFTISRVIHMLTKLFKKHVQSRFSEHNLGTYRFIFYVRIYKYIHGMVLLTFHMSRKILLNSLQQ